MVEAVFFCCCQIGVPCSPLGGGSVYSRYFAVICVYLRHAFIAQRTGLLPDLGTYLYSTAMHNFVI